MSDELLDDRDIRLGSLALRSNLLNPDQLRRVLALQAEEALEGRAVPIGVLMVRKGFLTREQLQELLTRQESLRRPKES
jgi:hypothetical protein